MLKLKDQNGFTLTELIGIIAAIAGLIIVIMGINSVVDQNKKTGCLASQVGVLKAVTNWASTINPSTPNGNRQLCNMTKQAVDSWNEQCADVMSPIAGPNKCEP